MWSISSIFSIFNTRKGTLLALTLLKGTVSDQRPHSSAITFAMILLLRSASPSWNSSTYSSRILASSQVIANASAIAGTVGGGGGITLILLMRGGAIIRLTI